MNSSAGRLDNSSIANSCRARRRGYTQLVIECVKVKIWSRRAITFRVGQPRYAFLRLAYAGPEGGWLTAVDRHATAATKRRLRPVTAIHRAEPRISPCTGGTETSMQL